MNLRRLLAGAWAIAPLAAVLVTLTVLPPPDRVPTSWSGPTPDGFTTGPAFASTVLTLAALAALGAAAVALLQRAVPQSWSRWAVAVLAALGWGAWLVYLLTVWRARVDGAEGMGAGWPLVAVAGAFLAGAVGYAVHGRRLPTAAELAAQVPDRARVRPVRGRAVRPVQPWETRLTSRTLQVIAWLVAGVAGGMGVVALVQGQPWWLLLLLVLVGVGTWVIAWAWSAVRVVVDAEGLEIRSRTLPLRVARVPAAEVAGVEVAALEAARWGGIGLRALPGRTAYIVALEAPGIVVHRRDGRRLALQVTEGDQVARDGARTLLQAAGQRLGETSATGA